MEAKTCPACSRPNAGDVECRFCGVIFSKWQTRQRPVETFIPSASQGSVGKSLTEKMAFLFVGAAGVVFAYILVMGMLARFRGADEPTLADQVAQIRTERAVSQAVESRGKQQYLSTQMQGQNALWQTIKIMSPEDAKLEVERFRVENNYLDSSDVYRRSLAASNARAFFLSLRAGHKPSPNDLLSLREPTMGPFLLAMIESGLDVNARFGAQTPLMWAAQNKPTAFKILADAGAEVEDVDSMGASVLAIASYWGCTECVEKALQKGADPNRQDREGRSALDRAIEQRRSPIVAMLSGFRKKQYDNSMNVRPLLGAADDEDAALLKQLLAGGEDVNQVDGNGQSALHHAARSGCIPCVETLLQSGARADLSDYSGKHAVDVARESQKLQLTANVRNDFNKVIARLESAEHPH